MGLTFPYTYISCPCSDRSISDDNRTSQSLFLSANQSQLPESAEISELPFDPRHPRSSFSLFPPDHVLYCEECKDLKCPRCILEEQVSYYCTSCLFETPSIVVRGEGNRCARNCFNCPICFSQLTVNALDGAVKDGSWILNCNYCMWTSLDIGIKLDKPVGIRSQLEKLANGGKPQAIRKLAEDSDTGRKPSNLGREPLVPPSESDEQPLSTPPQTEQEATSEAPLDHTSRFMALKAFYKTQLTTSTAAADSNLPNSLSSEINYSSPSSLARLLSLYSTSTSTYAQNKKKPKPHPMREALSANEGLYLPNPTLTAALATQSRLVASGFSATTTLEQRAFQLGPGGVGDPAARFVDQLRPMPAPLTMKRAKRCKECRHLLVKPEPKPSSTRYRIKLAALGYIPSVGLKPLLSAGAIGPAAILGSDDVVLDPGKPSQWILKLQNPLFDDVRVSLATPTVTPGTWGHRVTILCPQFEVGRSSDVWDEALNLTGAKGGRGEEGGGGGGGGGGGKKSSAGAGAVAEAGKVYDRGRNWTSVVLEIVPVPVNTKGGLGVGGGEGGNGRDLEEDEDVVEVPVRVRLEWTHAGLEGSAASKRAKLTEDVVDDGRRELAYWMVLGVGRVKS